MFQTGGETFRIRLMVQIIKGEEIVHSIGLPEILVLMVLFGLGCMLPALIFRYRKQMMVHREHLTALEKGVPVPERSPESAPWTPRVYLLRGLIWLFAGIGLAVFLGVLSASSQGPIPLSERLFEAQRLRSSGGSEEEVKQLINSTENRRSVGVATPLIALVPVGVGLAYLIFYAGERKRTA